MSRFRHNRQGVEVPPHMRWTFLRYGKLILSISVMIFSQPILADTHSYPSRYDEATIDVSTMDPEAVIKLDGSWDFYWQDFLEFEDEWRPSDLRMDKIGYWTGRTLNNGEAMGSSGYGTYRLRIKGLRPRDDGYLLLLVGINSAARARVYSEAKRELIAQAQSGIPSRHDVSPSKHPLLLHFNPKEQSDLLVIIHVASQDDGLGGLRQPPSLGPPKLVRRPTLMVGLANAVSMGVALAVGFYSVFIFLRRRQDKASLALAGFGFAVFLRTLSTTEFFVEIMPESSFTLLRRIEYFTMPAMITSCYYFVLAAFFPTNYRVLSYTILLSGIGLMTLCAAMPPRGFTPFLSLFQLHILLSAGACLWLLIHALLNRSEDAWLSLIGISITILGAVYDIVFVSILHFGNFLIGPIYVAIFLLIQSQLVAKRAADAYRSAERYAGELIEKEKARTAFFHNTSHELRTPLNGIIGFLELFQQGRFGEPTDTMKAQFTKVLRLAISLKNQVNIILDLAKLNRGELEFQNTRIDLNELVDEIESLADGLQFKYKDSSFTLETNWDPASVAPAFTHDREKLLSIVRNLLGNAFKFSRTNSANAVSCSLRLEDECLKIEVRDRGIGIPDAEKEVIFNEFKQVQSDARRAYEGTGLGLALVKRIVDLSGGSIELESTLGEGSCFRLSLPEQKASLIATESHAGGHDISQKIDIYPAFNPTDKPVIKASQDSGNLISLHATGKTILVVDDNEMNCEVIQHILTSYGYNVEIADGGRACLEYLKLHRPDLILLDLMMPEVSGEDVMYEIRKNSLLSEIPVIIVTARASEEDCIQGLKMGADDYVAKPIIAPELVLRVQNLLSRIDLTRLSEHLESREKMALMGELLGELSHEIKNVNASVLVDQTDSLQDIDLLWSSLGLPASADVNLVCRPGFLPNLQSRVDQMIIPSHCGNNKASLEVLRIILASSSLGENQIDQVWAEILSFPTRQLLITEAMMSLASTVIRMSDSGKRTYELIEIILRYGKDPNPNESCHLAEAVHEALNLLSMRIRSAGIEVQVEIPTDIQVVMSRIELGQIILNLVHNAIDAYRDDDSAQIKFIRIRHELGDDHHIHLMCENRGKPIPPEFRDKLFERGFSTKGAAGSGLGLYISKKIAQRVQGDLRLREVDPSTCFDLILRKAG